MRTSTPPSVPQPLGGVSPDFADLFAAEDRHFWFRSRNHVLASVVRRLTTGLAAGYRVLEVGCGTGNVLRELAQVCHAGEVIGLDLFEEGLTYARKRTCCQVVRGDIHQLPFSTPFDLVGLFDVLEHLPDDRRALGDLYAALNDGGRLVLTVPAHMTLWSHTDVYAQHYRRYSRGGLIRVLEESGFRVEYASQFMMALFPIMWLSRRLRGLGGRTEAGDGDQNRELFLKELRIVPGFNGLMTQLLRWEAIVLSRWRRLPFGTSLLAVATKGMAAVPLRRCA